MLVIEAKLRGKQMQYDALNEAIRTANFVRNKAVRYWQDNVGAGKNDLQKLCAVLASEFEWASKLNSMARQASADRAWFAVARFYANCKAKKIMRDFRGKIPSKTLRGKKGFPKYKKKGHSVEYKTSGWRLSQDKKYVTFTDGFKAGTFKLVGTRDLNFYQINQIKRVRIVKRADGYYCQFCVDIERNEAHQPTGLNTGIDVGLEFFYTDSSGQTVDNPRLLRKSEKSLKRSQRRVSRCKKKSSNRKRFIKRLAKKHLKVSRQRKDFVVQTSRALVLSSDLVVYEDLQVRNMVRNHHLAKSISDASWSMFTGWLDYFAKVYGVWAVAVPPHYTSQDCSGCGARVKKSLSTRTHRCSCGVSLHRDHNAAKLILKKGLNTVGQTGINASGQNNLWLGGATPLGKLAG